MSKKPNFNYVRKCRRCDELFRTTGRRSKICQKCRITPLQARQRNIEIEKRKTLNIKKNTS